MKPTTFSEKYVSEENQKLKDNADELKKIKTELDNEVSSNASKPITFESEIDFILTCVLGIARDSNVEERIGEYKKQLLSLIQTTIVEARKEERGGIIKLLKQKIKDLPEMINAEQSGQLEMYQATIKCLQSLRKENNL